MSKAKGGVRPNSGRKAGSKNERTIQWEELGHSLITRHSERANEILANCDDEVFMENYTKLLEYFKPKLARQNIDLTSEGEKIAAPTIIING